MNKKVDISSGEEVAKKDQKETRLTCGIIMPIATMSSEYTADHWSDVRHILHNAIEKAGFTPRIVSDSEESTVIHGSIINNIYNDAIIVCDVSNKNANVMFELGMRLAFNKPVVIVKDDKTDYSFDTGNIQHEPYRKDLRHSTVEKFIDDLSKKIIKTYEASQKEEYQSFLSYFGKFEVAKVENKPIGESEALEKLLNKMTLLESQIKNLNHINLESNTILSTDNLMIDYQIQYPDKLSVILNEIEATIPVIKEVSYSFEKEKFYIKFNEKISMNYAKKYDEKIKNIIKGNDDELPF
ncbi:MULTISPECIES: hypothetical protein [Acinetobacter]|jgi:hypothetical protein|uniref:Nucleoside 2-deoxyribosyltransferase n=2 Tax=Acinetobacter lwoffii TaxID=28090 RepID=N9G5J1_ACILW|nr:MULTISPECIES: hypothetical protein [Acinetobacter]ENW30177.1 hypothetical protein F923_01816 [Acinetobacter lwoffii NIPH 478]